MNQSGTYILVHLVEKQPAGYRFVRSRAAWPLHITLVPWFVIAEDRVAVLTDGLAAYAQKHAAFVVTVGSEALFGGNQDIPVNVLADPAATEVLHTDLVNIVQADFLSYAVANPFIAERFVPHITHHEVDGQVRRVAEGSRMTLDEFSLVRLGPAEEPQMCEVVRNFKLAGV